MSMRGKIALNDSNAYVSAGLAGLGILQITELQLEPYLADGRFELLFKDWNTDPIPVHVVYPQNRHLSAKVRIFVEWIAELFSSQSALTVPRAIGTETLGSPAGGKR